MRGEPSCSMRAGVVERRDGLGAARQLAAGVVGEGAVREQLAHAREVAGVDALAVDAEQVADLVTGRHGRRVY